MSARPPLRRQTVATQKIMTSADKAAGAQHHSPGNCWAPMELCSQYRRLIRAAKTKLRCERGRIAANLAIFTIMRARCPCAQSQRH